MDDTRESVAQPVSLRPFAAATRVLAPPATAATDVEPVIAWAVGAARDVPPPGAGRTRETWEALASVAAVDVAAARILESHLDALAILRQAADANLEVDRAGIGADDDASWGVFAAEGARLEARETPDGWRLDGTKNWCSLASQLSHALVTAWASADTRRLFAVSLRGPEVSPHRGPWVSRGLPGIVSAPVDFTGARAVPVGDDGWYLRRPGFEWGGMGVAAVWWGGATPIVCALARRAGAEGADQLATMFAGAADAASWSARAVLAEAADAVDAGVSGNDLKVLAERVRSVTTTQVEDILATADRALGPGPLTTDESHAQRVADLRIYLRQHHGERDLARLGRLLAT